MQLAKLLEKGFAASARQRGFELARTADIILGGFDGQKVIVSIDSEDDSELLIMRRKPNRRIFINCPCREFSASNACSHLWSVILTIDQQQRRDLAKFMLESFGVKPPKDWRNVIHKIQKTQEAQQFRRPTAPIKKKRSSREIVYVIETEKPVVRGQTGFSLSVMTGQRRADGGWHALRKLKVNRELIGGLVDPVDQQALKFLRGASDFFEEVDTNEFELERNWDPDLIASLIQSKRFCWARWLRTKEGSIHPISRGGFATPGEIGVELTETDGAGSPATFAAFVKLATPVAPADPSALASQEAVEEVLDNQSIQALSRDGIVLANDSIYIVKNPEAVAVWYGCRENPDAEVSSQERESFLEKLSTLGGIVDVRLPASWEVTEQTAIVPRGELRLKKNDYQKDFYAELFITYDQIKYHFSDQRLNTYDAATKRWFRRNKEAESRLIEAIEELPVEFTRGDALVSWDLKFPEGQLLDVIKYLADQNWRVLLEGLPIRTPSRVAIVVESGQDWFDVSTELEFDGQSIALPELLTALKQKQHFIKLADGSRGQLPDEIIARYASLSSLGRQVDGVLRFQNTQAAMLDAMLDAQEYVSFDEQFLKVRKRLDSFKGVKPKTPPKTFVGTLREYQREGLGWLHFLCEYGFGGCLADDMGLGKTVQVLGMLEKRRTRRVPSGQSSLVSVPESKAAAGESTRAAPVVHTEIMAAAARCKRRPSIVVVPKSLIFNWIEEAEKFTPKLFFFNYTGTGRKQRLSKCDSFDVLITTYGTLRKDIVDLANIHFDYAILDESQAIKNASAQVAKASQLIVADHRLAMTGTPVENHLGELWSLFEFLNPGMLGASGKFEKLTRIGKSSEKESQVMTRALVRALQPFVLRRTKEQVLEDLPAKTEQTLFCDMTPVQRKKYEELKKFYQVKLKKKVDTEGIGKTKIHVLEALLRLRQAACDPRLLDKDNKPGAKLELLQQQIEEVVAEGHKVLVFSQFTSLLTLVREQFDAGKIRYEYLDGQTSDRQAPVARFQNAPSVSAFLISLKAGGHGLNLTAADYVFLLDPWWNPAVEAQAIDRAHRMGQTRPVIAYRMICRDTVEEKIVELQKSKRELADSIIQADESTLQSLTAEDIQMLLK